MKLDFTPFLELLRDANKPGFLSSKFFALVIYLIATQDLELSPEHRLIKLYLDVALTALFIVVKTVEDLFEVKILGRRQGRQLDQVGNIVGDEAEIDIDGDGNTDILLPSGSSVSFDTPTDLPDTDPTTTKQDPLQLPTL